MFERKIYRQDMINCALCADAPCSKACGKLDCAALLRAIWFDDGEGRCGALSCRKPLRGLCRALRERLRPRGQGADPRTADAPV